MWSWLSPTLSSGNRKKYIFEREIDSLYVIVPTRYEIDISKRMYLQPQILKEETAAEAHWMCKRCIDSQPRAREVVEPKTSMVKASIRKVCSGRDQPQPPPDDMTKLPYDVSIQDNLL